MKARFTIILDIDLPDAGSYPDGSTPKEILKISGEVLEEAE